MTDEELASKERALSKDRAGSRGTFKSQPRLVDTYSDTESSVLRSKSASKSAISLKEPPAPAVANVKDSANDRNGLTKSLLE